VFGMTTLLSLISISYGIENSMYYIFLVIFELEEEHGEQNSSTMIYDLSWYLFYHVRLIFLAFIAHSTTAEVKYIAH
jgi:hypothetical protein